MYHKMWAIFCSFNLVSFQDSDDAFKINFDPDQALQNFGPDLIVS